MNARLRNIYDLREGGGWGGGVHSSTAWLSHLKFMYFLFSPFFFSLLLSLCVCRSLTSMFPHEARLRNLTYNSPLYCDISCKTYEADGGAGAAEAEEERENPKEFLGWVPIMLRSSFCVLVSTAATRLIVGLSRLGECEGFRVSWEPEGKGVGLGGEGGGVLIRCLP